MRIRSDTLLASFVVALCSSFLTSLAVLLVKTLAVSKYDVRLFADITVNILILFFLSGFIFFKGSAMAAWRIYRHDVAWGYKLEMRQIMPIFVISFLMAASVFAAIYFYATGEIERITHLAFARRF